MENASEVLVSTRISKSLYEKVLKRQRDAKEKTGIEPKVSAVLRVMLEEAAEKNGRKR